MIVKFDSMCVIKFIKNSKDKQLQLVVVVMP